ncbi:MAG: hypothetical protein ACK4V2_01250 [Pseudomonadota bacterium]|jgi:hypothetical protein|nr:hypothetical protein [Alphaproteobacteria bacterium]
MIRFFIFVIILLFANVMPSNNACESVFDPYADMCLSAFPGHPHPPIYKVTLPKGQEIIFLGTVHTVPLECFLPYKVAHQLIEASQYIIDEINGELLGTSYEEKYRNAFQKAFNGQDPEYVDVLYVTQSSKQKMADDLIKAYTSDYASMDIITATSWTNSMLDRIFDENDCWYHKAGLQVESDSLLEASAISVLEEGNLSLKIPGLTYKCIKINDVVYKVPTHKGKDLAPEIFAYLVPNNLELDNLYFSKLQFYGYSMPDVVGVEDHLISMKEAQEKILSSLEESPDRFILEDFRDLEVSFDDVTIVKKEDIDNFLWHVFMHPLTFEDNTQILYSKEQPLPLATSLRRNSLWTERLMTLNDKHFKQGFVFIGEGHLLDLFSKLADVGCTISNRLSVAELERFLLDEVNVLNEHERRKIAMQRAFGY